MADLHYELTYEVTDETKRLTYNESYDYDAFYNALLQIIEKGKNNKVDSVFVPSTKHCCVDCRYLIRDPERSDFEECSHSDCSGEADCEIYDGCEYWERQSLVFRA